MISQTDTSCFLCLPREIRDQIIGEVIFPSEKEPRSLEQKHLGVATTARRQIFPYHMKYRGIKPKRDVAIIRACRQLQSEAEAILYGTSSFNLMYYEPNSFRHFSYDFLQDRPKRLRRLIQRIECRCYNESAAYGIQLLEWSVFCKFLATQCPSLHSLKLWGFSNEYHSAQWLNICKEDKEWVQALLQIRTLRHFDIQMLPGGYIDDLKTFRSGFLAWIRDAMVNRPKPVVNVQPQSQQSPPFPFLSLPRGLRNQVYREIALPRDKRINPGVGGWYHEAARDGCNLSLTCKRVHYEVLKVLYGQAIFASDLPWHYQGLFDFINTHYNSDNHAFLMPKHHMWPIKHIALRIGIDARTSALTELPCLLKRARLESLELTIDAPRTTIRMCADWRDCYENNKLGEWRGDFTSKQLVAIAHIPHVRVRMIFHGVIDASCLDWLENGLRCELLKGKPEIPSLEWLYTPLDEDIDTPFEPEVKWPIESD